jgi:hypothetical protein
MTDYSAFGTVDLLSYNCTDYVDIPLQDCDDLCIVLPHTSQMPQNFYDAASDPTLVTNYTTVGYSVVTVYVDGAPASTGAIQVREVINFELVFDDSSGNALLALPSPPANPILTGAANKVTSSMTHLFQRGLQAAGRAVFTAAETALVGYFLGPRAAANVAIMNVD